MSTATAPSNRIADEEDRFTLTSATEIAFLLRGIMKHKSLITAYAGGSNDFVLTSIVEVNPAKNTLVFDLGPDEEINRRLLASDRLLFTTSHERVKVKFSSGRATPVSHGRHAAFQVALPQRLVRMQRREFYRVSTSIVNPLKCLIGMGDDSHAEVTLLDISIGGVALIDQHHAVDLEPGNVFPDCRIALPGQGVLRTGLQVCNTFEITLRSGLACKRSGCRFTDIGESDRGLVQRYITQLEREQRSKGMLG